MKRIKVKAIATALAVSMVFSTMSSVSYVEAYSSDAQMLNELTEQDRSIIKKVEAEAFVIDPAILSDPSEVVKVIVELKEPSVAEVMSDNAESRSINNEQIKMAQITKVNKQQEEFKAKANEIFKDKQLDGLKISQEYSYTFNGMAMELPKTEIKTLLDTGMVKRIWKDEVVQAPQPENLETSQTKEGQGLPAALPHIGVDKLHGEGVTGEGVKVAVIDTGIDYNHPDLKDSYKGGYDFVDNDNDPMEATIEDWRASGRPEIAYGTYYYTSHGTHVSGTIAANPKNEVEYAVTGVAPKVDLYVYRVLGPYGMGENSNIIAAIEYSVEQGMDVINLSLGSSLNNSLSPTSVAINNAAKLGVVPCIAAGNSGEGIGTLGSPGTSPLAITVGASTLPTDIPSIGLTLGEATFDGKLLASDLGSDEKLLTNNQYEVVDVGTGYSYQFEESDLNGKVALIKRGWLSLSDLISKAKKGGAVALLLYNNVEGEIPYFFGESADFIPTFTLTREEGQAILSELEKDSSSLLGFGELTSNIEPGDYLADFSSRGPVLDNYDIKPDVVAPGVNILSTFPEFINSPEADTDYSKAYYYASGTSMATPHVAGIAALILQSHPEYGVEDVKAALANTAEPLAEGYNVFEIGAGRVDAYEAVHTDNLVQVMDEVNSVDKEGNIAKIDNITSSLRFGAIPESPQDEANTLEVQVTNFSNVAENFNVSVEFLNMKNTSGESLNAAENGVTLEMTDTVTVPANGVVSLDATIKIPTTASQGTYQGYVYFTNAADSNESFRVPFAVRHTNNGFAYVITERFASSNNYDNVSPHFYPYMSAILKLNSSMERIDIVVRDLDGNIEGYIAQLDARGSTFDVDYFLYGFYDGYYFPVLEDGEIGKQSLIPVGEYTLDFVGYDVFGETFEVSNPLLIDNKKPDISFNENEYPGLYEVSEEDFTVEKDSNGEEYEAIWFHGNMHDSTVERLGELGYTEDNLGVELNQTSNTISLYKDSQYAEDPIYADENGDFKFSITKAEIEEQPLYTELYYYDYATAGNSRPQKIFVVKEGQPYSTVTYSQDSVKLNDNFNATVSVQNAEDFVKGSFSLDIRDKEYEYTVKLSDAFLKAVEEAGGIAKVEKKSTFYSTSYEVTVDGAALSGDLDVLQVDAKVIGETFWDEIAGFANVNGSSYENSQGIKTNLRTYSKGFTFISKSSGAMVDVSDGEGVANNFSVDFTKAGVTTWLEDSAGNKYEPTSINWIGFAYFDNIPAIKEDYTLYVDTPGHFLFSTNLTLWKETGDGEIGGTYAFFHPVFIAAGDIDRDNVIDINDALYILDNFSTNVREADINCDNVVNNKDLQYVVNNFGMKNPTNDQSPEPVLESDGIVLDDIVKDLEDGIANLRLQLLINKVKGLDGTKYTEETWASVSSALETAVQINENPASTQQQINEAKEALEQAFNGLVKAVVKTHLQLAVTEAEKISEDELNRVVPVVVKEFKAALSEANEILANKAATQEEVDASWTRLTEVMQKLSFYKGDKTSLIALIAEITKLDKEEFLTEPWAYMEEVLAEANVIVADENAMEKEVTEVYEKLMKAFLDLRLVPNKEKLQGLINKAEALDKSTYTEESWNKLVAALDIAKAVINNREAEQEEVDNATNGLQLAMESLVENNNSGNTDDEDDTDNNLPATGGALAGSMMGMLGIASAVAGVVIIKKKREE